MQIYGIHLLNHNVIDIKSLLIEGKSHLLDVKMRY